MKMARTAKSFVFVIVAAGALACSAMEFSSDPTEGSRPTKSDLWVTNVEQFRTLSGADFLAGCNFRLTGAVTLVDTNRNLLVVQDDTGAVALNFLIGEQKLEVGQLVTLDGFNCCPYFTGFPDYPYRPSACGIEPSFEFPMDLQEYRLTRMRGYVRAPVTGKYCFWIASDNSSELWLSTDADPSNARKIAYIQRFGYVDPHEWSKFASQRSELIELKAGETYYIEALQEQTTGGENLSVAWQGPDLPQAVIEGRYLTPWHGDNDLGSASNHGVLREVWTNYPAGNVEGMVGARPFESALTVKTVQVHVDGPGELPKPLQIDLNQPLSGENNYRWVQAAGVVKFRATDGDAAILELSDGPALVRVRASHWSQDLWKPLSNAVVRIEGVCEGVDDDKGTLMPGQIWATAKNSVSPIELGAIHAAALARNQLTPSVITNTSAVQGFFNSRGIVTFNGRVFDKDYVLVQGDDSVMLVAPGNHSFASQLEVGENVDLGGALEPGNTLPVITPLFVMERGRRPMPLPIIQPPGVPIPHKLEGMWSEFEGVVQSVNTNGTLSVVGKDGPVYLWLNRASPNDLARYVDARLRARGALMLHLLDAPVVLIPSQDFIDVEEDAPLDPFGIRRSLIADLFSQGMEPTGSHRVRVAGEVTYRDAQSFFLQDDSGGIRVRTTSEPSVNVGETAEVLAFPALNNFVPTLTNPMARPAKSINPVRIKDLDLSEALSSKQNGALVRVTATLLARKTNGLNQVLELQEQQRIFTATLATGQDRLPDLLPGSQIRVIGVRDDELTASALAGEKPPATQFLTSLNILLRSPQDVTLLNGPPWWTWKKTATLVILLLTILVATVLWIHLLHRRIERQRAAQLVFSRHVLERLEDERRRIAVNLHDSLGQTLMVIKNHAILAIQRPPEADRPLSRLDEISGATSQAIEEVRRITHGLRPYQLDRLGLTQAIRASVNEASENNSILFACRVEAIDGLFDKDAEIHVYRIVQEAITNVVKHSAATEAAVVIRKRATVVSLSIRDNGRGFDPAKTSSRQHDLGYGLNGIAERVRILGGTLEIDTRPGGGTNITVEVPFPHSKP
jgi:signal transduction histidine kinase